MMLDLCLGWGVFCCFGLVLLWIWGLGLSSFIQRAQLIWRPVSFNSGTSFLRFFDIFPLHFLHSFFHNPY